MQAVILDFSERKPIVSQASNARLQGVENEVADLGQRVTVLASDSSSILASITDLQASIDRHPKSSWKTPPVIVAVIAAGVSLLGVTGTFCTLVYNTNKVERLSTKIDGVTQSINGDHGLATRVARLDSGLRLLTAAVAPQLLHEMDKTLDESAKAAQGGRISTASANLDRVADQANALRLAGVAANQAFFSNAASTLATISSKDAKITTPAWVSLAAYHSAVIHPSNLATVFAPGSKQSITTEELANIPKNHDTTINGFQVYITSKTLGCPTGGDVVGVAPVVMFNVGDKDWVLPVAGTRKGMCKISNIAVVTPIQTLDEFVWSNVVFVNARIRYLGGPVTLNNVRFVNCTFDVPAKGGHPILNYAMAQQSELIVPGENSSPTGR